MKNRDLTVLASVLLFSCGDSGTPERDGEVASVQEAATVVRTNPGPVPAYTAHVIPKLPTESPPDSYTSGAIPGKGEVSDGVYDYEIPLRTPKGVAGLEPRLGIAYSSTRPNGVLGVGAALTGVSAVTRCTHTVARDGFAAGFDFNSDFQSGLNQYCIDGNLLIPIARTADTVSYQSERADFSKIEGIFDGARDPIHFIVHKPDGRVYHYGADALGGANDNPNSRVDGPLNGATTNPSGGHWTHAWYLTRVVDPDGNQINYRYAKDAGGFNARRVTSAAHSRSGDTRYLTSVEYGNTKVVYDYEPRPDTIESYAFGFDLGVSQRLSKISVNRKDAGGGLVPTWHYQLSYAESPFTGRSQLTSIQMRDQFGIKLPETVFTWNSGTSAYDPSAYQTASYPIVGPNGCPINQGQSSCLPENFTRLVVADFNGDGADDVLYSVNDLGAQTYRYDRLKARLKIRFGSPSGLGPETEAIPGSPGAFTAVDLAHAVAADFDGNGAAELVAPVQLEPLGSALQYDYVAYRWDGTQLARVMSTGLSTVAAAAGHPAAKDAAAWNIADVNGDGVPDVILQIPQGLANGIYLGLPSDPFTQLNMATTPLPGPAVSVPTFWADADGDARADAIKSAVKGVFFKDISADGLPERLSVPTMQALRDCGGGATQTVRLDTKQNFGRPRTWLGTSSYIISQDVVLPAPATACQAVSEALTNPVQTLTLDADYGGSVRLADFNGDGKTDFLLLNVGLDRGLPVYDRSDGDDVHNRFVQDQYSGINNLPGDRIITAIVRPKATAFLQKPVLLLSSTDPLTGGSLGYKTVILPSSARVREDRYDKLEVWGLSGRDPNYPRDPWRSHYWNGTSVGDINGDGLADVVQLATNAEGTVMFLETIVAKIANDRTTRADVVVAVKDGFASKASDGDKYAEKITYRDLSALKTSGRYARPIACVPALGDGDAYTSCRTRGLVVDSYRPGRQSPSVVGDLDDIQYSYEADHYDRKGRGSIGFGTVTEWNRRLGIKKVEKRTFERTSFLVPSDDFGSTTYAASSITVHDDNQFPSYVSWNTGFEGDLLARLFYPRVVKTTITQSELLVDFAFNTVPAVTAPLLRTTTTTTNELATYAPNGTEYGVERAHVVRPAESVTKQEYFAATTSTAPPALSPVDKVSSVSYFYDAYSNPTDINRSTTDGNAALGSLDLLTIDYYNRATPTTWAIGFPKEITQHRIVNGSDITRKKSITYWPDWRPHIVTEAPGGDHDVLEWTAYTYTPQGNVATADRRAFDDSIGATSSQSRLTTYTYDSTNIYLATVKNALDQVTTFTFEPSLGVPIAIVDPNNIGTDYLYDGFGRERCMLPDDGAATCTKYTLATSDPGISDSSMAYVASSASTCAFGLYGTCFVEKAQEKHDTRGNVVRSALISSTGIWWEVLSTYDGRNRLSKRSQPKGTTALAARHDTTHSYDGLDRIITIRNPDQSTRTWSYPQAFKSVYEDEVRAKVTSTTNVDGQLVLTDEVLSTPTPHSVTTGFVYDAFGDPLTISVTAATNRTRTTTMTYDQRGRQTSLTTPAAGTVTRRFNGFGELRRLENALGSRNYQRDKLGRVYRASDPNDSSSYEEYVWDTITNGIGRLKSSTRSPDNVTQAYEYSVFGQLGKVTTSTPSTSYAVRYLYDEQSRVKNIVYPAPALNADAAIDVLHKYSPAGYLTSLDLVKPSSQNLWKLTVETPFEIKETSNDTSTTQTLIDPVTMRPDDINVTWTKSTWKIHYEYHADGQEWTRTTKTNQTEVGETFLYDELKRLKTWQHTNAVTAASYRREYGYNDFGDLTDAKTYPALSGGTASLSETYTMSVTTPRSIPAAVSQDTTVLGTSTYKYDTLGRRTEKKTGNVVTSFTGYNHWNLPTRIETTGTTIDYRYDANGARAVRSVNPASPNPEATYYAGGLFEDRVVAGKHTFFSFVKARDKIVAEIEQPSSFGTPSSITIRCPHHDRLGSTSIVTTQTEGPGFYYEPFGARINRDTTDPLAPNDKSHFDFNGHEADPLGLTNMKGRLYDPAQRRFLSPDPFVSRPSHSQGYAPYSFARNNPVNVTDPTGLWPEWPVDAFRDAWNWVVGGTSVRVPGTKVDVPIGYLLISPKESSLDPRTFRADYYEEPGNGDEVASGGVRYQVAENEGGTITDGVPCPSPTCVVVNGDVQPDRYATCNWPACVEVPGERIPSIDRAAHRIESDPFGLQKYMREHPLPPSNHAQPGDAYQDAKKLDGPAVSPGPAKDTDQWKPYSPPYDAHATGGWGDELLEAIGDLVLGRSKFNDSGASLPSVRNTQHGTGVQPAPGPPPRAPVRR